MSEAPAVLERLSYFIFRALRNMRQWTFLCSASILTMAVALACVASFFLVVVNIEQLAQRWTEEIQIVAYLDQPIPTEQRAALMKELKDFPEVEAVVYVSPQEAMDRFKERLHDDTSLLDGVSDDLLPASFELGLAVQYRNQEGIDRVSEKLAALLDLDELRYGQSWLERFTNFIHMLRFVGVVLGAFFLLAALFIVSNTIRLTLYARRDELEIMALVGATMHFIKIPFILEGAVQGLIGGIVSLLFLLFSFRFIIAHGLHSFWLTPADFDLLFLSVSQQLLLVLSGVLLGMLGSLASLRRFVHI
jgi:cell division transport system permease protein